MSAGEILHALWAVWCTGSAAGMVVSFLVWSAARKLTTRGYAVLVFLASLASMTGALIAGR